MLILTILMKIILFPIYLVVCFAKTWMDLLAKIGCVLLGIFYLLMLCIIIMLICRHSWVQLGIAIGFSFVGFLESMSLVAAGTLLEAIGDKIGELIAG